MFIINKSCIHYSISYVIK